MQKSNIPAGPWLKMSAVAEILGVGKTTVKNLCSSGRLAHFRMGPRACIRISPAALDAFIHQEAARPTRDFKRAAAGDNDD